MKVIERRRNHAAFPVMIVDAHPQHFPGGRNLGPDRSPAVTFLLGTVPNFVVAQLIGPTQIDLARLRLGFLQAEDIGQVRFDKSRNPLFMAARMPLTFQETSFMRVGVFCLPLATIERVGQMTRRGRSRTI